jgi:formylglycine-generating enzyme required for sulfatase activity
MVYLSAYFIDKYEVTNKQFRAFLDWRRNAKNPRKFDHPEAPAGLDPTPAFLDDPRFNGPEKPVVGVDWFAAWAYARWAGKTLPTEAQWEKAASSDLVVRIKSKFPWGNEDPTPARALFGGEKKGPGPVTALGQGRSPLGALQMAGNASEWCLDAYEAGFLEELLEEYPANKNRWAVNPFHEGPPDGPHAVRGGSWADDAGDLRVTCRNGRKKADNRTGFRCSVWHVKRE